MWHKRISTYSASCKLACVIAALFSCSAFAKDNVIFLATENYPPYNIYNPDAETTEGQISGYSTDIVHAAMKNAGYTPWDEALCAKYSDGNTKGHKAQVKGQGLRYCMKVYPWKRALDLAQNKQNHGVFSTVKTDARTPLFEWVGPIAELNWVLMSRKNADITINAIEEASQYRIGGYQGSAVTQFLTEENGINVDQVRKDTLNFEKLRRDRINLWATSNLYGPFLAQKNDFYDLKTVYVLKQKLMYIAFSPSTPDETIRLINQSIDTIKQDGTVAAIGQKYGLN